MSITRKDSRSLLMKSVRTNNPEPTYITAEEVITPECAKTLMDLVDERGKRSEWSYNPWCTELQISNPFSKVRTENDEKIISVLPELFGIGESFMRHVNWNFGNTVCELATGHHGFWVLRYDEGGSFDQHCDWDSGPEGIRPPIVATVAISLNDWYEGGRTVLFDSTGAEAMIEQPPLFGAIAWDGFTQHMVEKITSKSRYALVIHYTGTIK